MGNLYQYTAQDSLRFLSQKARVANSNFVTQELVTSCHDILTTCDDKENVQKVRKKYFHSLFDKDTSACHLSLITE